MTSDITYCANHDCKHKYKCNTYRNAEKKVDGQEFWFTVYNPNDCPNKEVTNANKTNNSKEENSVRM